LPFCDLVVLYAGSRKALQTFAKGNDGAIASLQGGFHSRSLAFTGTPRIPSIDRGRPEDKVASSFCDLVVFTPGRRKDVADTSSTAMTERLPASTAVFVPELLLYRYPPIPSIDKGKARRQGRFAVP